MNYITIPEPKFSRYADNHMTCLTNCPKFVMMQPQKRDWIYSEIDVEDLPLCQAESQMQLPLQLPS